MIWINTSKKRKNVRVIKIKLLNFWGTTLFSVSFFKYLFLKIYRNVYIRKNSITGAWIANLLVTWEELYYSKDSAYEVSGATYQQSCSALLLWWTDLLMDFMIECIQSLNFISFEIGLSFEAFIYCYELPINPLSFECALLVWCLGNIEILPMDIGAIFIRIWKGKL